MTDSVDPQGGDDPRGADRVRAAILRLTKDRGPDKSICPTEAARAVDDDNWRRYLPHVRATAVGMARLGEVVIKRKGKVVDPNDFKGVYRIAAPP